MTDRMMSASDMERDFPVLRGATDLLEAVRWGIEIETDLLNNPAIKQVIEGFRTRAIEALNRLLELDPASSDWTGRAKSLIAEINLYRAAVSDLTAAIITGRQAHTVIERSEARG